MSERNLYQRLVDVMTFMGAIGKGGQTSYGEKYAYHKIDDIDDKLREALIQCGVVAVITNISDRKLEHFVDESRQGKITWYAECVVAITLINADTPTEKMDIIGWGQGLDFSDKATGKAISYAAKSAYLAAFHLRGQPDNEADNLARSKPALVMTPKTQERIDKIKATKTLEALNEIGDELINETPDVQALCRPAYREQLRLLK